MVEDMIHRDSLDGINITTIFIFPNIPKHLYTNQYYRCNEVGWRFIDYLNMGERGIKLMRI